MTIPAMSAPLTPMSSATTAMLDFPIDGLAGALAALTVLAIGVATSAYFRSQRAVRPTPVPRSAAA